MLRAPCSKSRLPTPVEPVKETLRSRLSFIRGAEMAEEVVVCRTLATPALSVLAPATDGSSVRVLKLGGGRSARAAEA